MAGYFVEFKTDDGLKWINMLNISMIEPDGEKTLIYLNHNLGSNVFIVTVNENYDKVKNIINYYLSR